MSGCYLSCWCVWCFHFSEPDTYVSLCHLPLQIYNEQITDLLDPSQKNLMVKRTCNFNLIYVFKEKESVFIFFKLNLVPD